MTAHVIAIPGGVAPAAQRYAPLKGAVEDATLHLKDLEVYSAGQPPADYSVEMEVAGALSFADSLGLDRFHLLGYSGGGFVSLALAAAHPQRLLSLAVFEPAGVPGQTGSEEREYRRRLDDALAGLSGADFMHVFTSHQVRPGVQLAPPSGPPEPWMRQRPAGIAAMMGSFDKHPLDRARFRGCDFPFFYGYGDQTSDYEEVKVSVLARLLPDLHVRRFPGLHHFLAPELIYNPEHVAELKRLWTGG